MTKKLDNKIKIIIEKEKDGKLELTTPFDSDIDEWTDIFKTILVWLTFSPETLSDIFKEN